MSADLDDLAALRAALLELLPVDGGHTIRKGPNLVPLFSQGMSGNV